MTNTPRLCRDCAFQDDYRCKRTILRDLVKGETGSIYRECYQERYGLRAFFGLACGRSGRYWKAKENLDPAS